MMEVTYNKEAQAIYIKVSDVPHSFGVVDHTEELVANTVMVDYLLSGEVYGIDVLGVQQIDQLYEPEICPTCEGKGKHLITGSSNSYQRCQQCKGTGKPDLLREEIVRTLFDNEYAVPKEWDWGTIKVQAPRSSIKCELLAEQILSLTEAHYQRKIDDCHREDLRQFVGWLKPKLIEAAQSLCCNKDGWMMFVTKKEWQALQSQLEQEGIED